MVEQDVGQLLFVFSLEQLVQGAGRQLGESLIGRSEDCEGTFTLERIHQFGSLNRSNQGGKASIRNSRVNNIHHLGFSRRENDRVDHVDHTIAGFNIGDDNLGVIDEHLTAIHFDHDLFAKHGLSFAQPNHVSSHHFVSHDMVNQDVGQLLLVLRLEQFIQRTRGQLGKRVVSRRENGERPFARKRFHQTSRLNRGYQGGEPAIFDCNVNNRLRSFRRGRHRSSGRLRRYRCSGGSGSSGRRASGQNHHSHQGNKNQAFHLIPPK